MRECIGLRSLVSVFGGEGEHPVPAPGKAGENEMVKFELRSWCGSAEDRALLGARVDVRQDGPRVRS